VNCNQAVICGEIVRLNAIRYTPTGIPVLEAVVRHQSSQQEAGIQRQIHCELPVVALGDTAAIMAKLKTGDDIRLEGFISRKSQINQQLVLHVNHIIQI